MRGFGANQVALRHRGLPRPARRRRSASTAGRSAGATRSSVGDAFSHRPGAREVGRHPEDAGGGEGRTTTRRERAGPRGRASPAASRTAASATACAEWGKAGSSSSTDGTISLYNGYTEMGQGLLTVLIQFAVEVTGPAGRGASAPKVDSTFALGCGQTTGSRATLFGGPRGARAPPRSSRPTSTRARRSRELAGRVYAGDVVIDDTTRARRASVAQDQDPHRLRLRHAGRASSTTRAASSAWSPRTTSAAPSTRRCARGRSRARSTWASATRSPRSCPCEDGMPVTFKLREIGVLRARDMPRGRGHPGRGARARGAVRRQGRRRDRPGADRRRGGRRARGVRRHPAHDAADEGLAGRAAP